MSSNAHANTCRSMQQRYLLLYHTRSTTRWCTGGTKPTPRHTRYVSSGRCVRHRTEQDAPFLQIFREQAGHKARGILPQTINPVRLPAVHRVQPSLTFVTG